MGVTKEEIDQIPTCPKCGTKMCVTPTGFFACGKDLTHTRLIPPTGMLPSKARKVQDVMALPIASEITKNPVVYLMGTRRYVRAKRGVDEDVRARILTPKGWTAIRLVEKREDGDAAIDNTCNNTTRIEALP